MGFVRQLNEGVYRIYQSMEKSMLSTPEFVEKIGNVYLTLRNKISNHTKTITDSILKIIQYNWSVYNDMQKNITASVLPKSSDN
jgi:ATP-dependent DNA helicase RecG